jgi:hypothetical protein
MFVISTIFCLCDEEKRYSYIDLNTSHFDVSQVWCCIDLSMVHGHQDV